MLALLAATLQRGVCSEIYSGFNNCLLTCKQYQCFALEYFLLTNASQQPEQVLFFVAVSRHAAHRLLALSRKQVILRQLLIYIITEIFIPT